MPLIAYEIPQETISDLEAIAEITGKTGKTDVIISALITYEWILYQQMKGMTVVGLAPEEVRVLERSKKISDEDERESLVTFFLPEKKEQLEAYFARVGEPTR